MADSQRDVMGSWSAAGVVKQSVTLREGLERAVATRRAFFTPRAPTSRRIKALSTT